MFTSFLLRQWSRLSLALAVTVGLWTPAIADTAVDTTGLVNGYSGYGYTFVGQTFAAPQNAALTSFSFLLVPSPFEGSPGHTGSLTLFVAAYDTVTRLAGPTLFTSAPQPLGAYDPPNGTLYTFNTGRLALAPGQEYLAYVSSSDSFANVYFRSVIHDNSAGSTTPGDAYVQGEAVASNRLSEAFIPFPDATKSLDLGFIATFSSPVPEASTSSSLGLLLVLGLGGVVITVRRKKQRVQVAGTSTDRSAPPS